ncbi:hypothetical protein PHYSODRAFT_321501 [Phytophthora sojae]|uniref:Helicase ATP-binding domain-containing protein n=1 Tax=Phytophthora sojae (strain P6497) TaxID=1094619 RepID=G4YIG1_PHYSP|nr:hypothetical protein PHYSODRAFT_321501 [Phytophthora sojae]EGZ27764.1 hypothetical protein PHYSODRAFT_321501 [Phytophthora sojae]|eukprot:XP_009515039.1 hypothetical protein PHYSODRAFT_321501 [Phytophthora sojae]
MVVDWPQDALSISDVHADVRRSTAVELRRTSDDWLKLVFSTRNGPVEKEAACVNSREGCRCDSVRLLRALVVLTERQIVSVRGVYAITTIDNTPVATLEFKVKVCNNARNYVGESLKTFELVLCHLQSDALAIARRSEKSRNEAKNSELLDATCSSCHVVGCRLHQWQVHETLGPKAKLHLPDVFQSLMAHMEAEQSEIRDDVVYRPKSNGSNVKITDLPKNALHLVVYFMDATELGAVSGVCSLFRHLAYAVVPGLNLVLYEHQRKGLKWMLYRETPSLIRSSTSHPFLFPRRPGRSSNVAIDMKVVKDVDTTTRDLCGGMFCDEPGLGKTITMLAYSLRPRDRSVAAEDLVSSGASLIVVPDPLVEHWKYQIEAHVESGALRTFIDETGEELPSNLELAACDVVVTSFSRLAREWRRHRPASALEKRMPERYGFEGIQRYSDGTIRGEVSSLLTVRWVRVIVDEGHELGGQTPTNLMLMARTVSAERRWVMTGTPTPNTLQSADLNYVHGLLLFLRNKPYGQPDARTWTKAIAKPFEHNKPIGFYRLQSLLSRILMRHTKESIREILPEPVWHTVYIDPTPSEYAQYNVVAAAVRANLVITSVDPEKPGKQHLDSH